MLLFRSRSERKGVVIFVVIGAIFVLSILVCSYNFFVRGKFNESREILKHIRASKCAQSLSKYIFSCLENDLNSSISDENSIGFKLKTKVFMYNKESDLSNYLNKEWYEPTIKNNCKNLFESILEDTIGSDLAEFNVEIGFTKVRPLNSLKSLKNIPNEIFFYDYEKIGKMTLKVTVNIGRSREIWQETRPFKVVFPFPVPITKFNLYWNDGVANSEYGALGFNRVSISADTGDSVNNKYPFLLDNGSIEDNDGGEVWKRRGWIYMGGENLLSLNRACGDKKYGERFYSYPRSIAGPPPALLLDFPGGDGLGSYNINNEILGFRLACWGFSETLTNSNTNSVWKKILKGEFEENPESKDIYWQSSCLHLFSHVDAKNNPEITPTITRVIGNIYDRFMEIGYLLPRDSSNSFFAAVINLTKDDFDNLKEISSDYSEDFNFDKYLFFSNGYQEQINQENRQKLQEYFDEYLKKKEYSNNDNTFSFREVMSKIRILGADVIYDIISQYSNSNNNINFPPNKSVPRIDELTFWPTNFTSNDENNGVLVFDTIRQMTVDKIGKMEDKTYGLSLRKCYEINGSSESIKGILNSLFGSSSDGFGWDLNNLVIEVSSDNTSEAINLGNQITIKSAGSIFRKEGPLRIGESSAIQTEKFPLLLLTGKGGINIDNSGNELMAYLIALGDEGTVKASNPNAPLKIRGGMAVKEFSPANIPLKGGHLAYNTELDPTKNSFSQYIGIVFGPKGGDL